MGVTGGTPVGFNVGVAAGDAGSTLPGIDLVCVQGKALTSTQRKQYKRFAVARSGGRLLKLLFCLCRVCEGCAWAVFAVSSCPPTWHMARRALVVSAAVLIASAWVHLVRLCSHGVNHIIMCVLLCLLHCRDPAQRHA